MSYGDISSVGGYQTQDPASIKKLLDKFKKFTDENPKMTSPYGSKGSKQTTGPWIKEPEYYTFTDENGKKVQIKNPNYEQQEFEAYGRILPQYLGANDDTKHIFYST